MLPVPELNMGGMQMAGQAIRDGQMTLFNILMNLLLFGEQYKTASISPDIHPCLNAAETVLSGTKCTSGLI